MSYERFKQLFEKAKNSNSSADWWKVSEAAEKLELYNQQAFALDKYSQSARCGR